MNASQNKLLVLGFLVSMFGTSGCLAVGALDRAAVEGGGNFQVADDDGAGPGEAGDDDLELADSGDDHVVVAGPSVSDGDLSSKGSKAPTYPLVGTVELNCSSATHSGCDAGDLGSAEAVYEVYAGNCADVTVGKSEILAQATGSMACTSSTVGKSTVVSCAATAGDFVDGDKARVTELEVSGGAVCYRASVSKYEVMSDQTLAEGSDKAKFAITLTE